MSGDSEHAIKGRQQFELSCEECRKQLYRFARHKVGNKPDAEDIAQEALARYLESRNRKGWQDEIKNPGAYMVTIADNLCKEVWSRRKGKTALDGDDEQSKRNRDALDQLAAEVSDSVTRLENDLRFQKLFELLPKTVVFGGLSEYELELLIMSKVDQMSSKEISKEIGEELKRRPELLPEGVSVEVATSPEFIGRRVAAIMTTLRARVRTLGLKLS